MYFSGKLPLTTNVTLPPFDSRGFGTTLKLSADNAPNLEEHDVRANKDTADKDKIRFLRMLKRFFKKGAASGTRTRTAITGQGILSPSCLPIPPLRPPKSGKRDSNPRPQPWQGCALPTELFPPDNIKNAVKTHKRNAAALSIAKFATFLAMQR